MTRVLIVDNSKLARQQAREPLEAAGYEISEASDGAEALDAIDASPPDAVVLNAEMPGTTLYEVIDALGEDHPEIPIVVSTARDDDETARQFLERGASDFLSKDPFYGVRIINAVHRGVTLGREPTVEVPEEEPGRVLVLDDSPVIRQVVRRILADAEIPLDVVEAESAEQALEMTRKEGFDVLLVDHVLPGMDGAQFLETLRAEGDRTPTMALTGQRDPELAERFLAAGAYGIWTKEHEGPLRLRTSVEQLVRLNRLDADNEPPPSGPGVVSDADAA